MGAEELGHVAELAESEKAGHRAEMAGRVRSRGQRRRKDEGMGRRCRDREAGGGERTRAVARTPLNGTRVARTPLNGTANRGNRACLATFPLNANHRERKRK